MAPRSQGVFEDFSARMFEARDAFRGRRGWPRDLAKAGREAVRKRKCSSSPAAAGNSKPTTHKRGDTLDKEGLSHQHRSCHYRARVTEADGPGHDLENGSVSRTLDSGAGTMDRCARPGRS